MFPLAATSEMLFLDRPWLDRVRRIDELGFQVEMWDWTTKDLGGAAALGLVDGERVRVVSRRGQVEAPIRIEASLRPGLVFMTFHFQDDVATNLLTIDATDPKSGTAEFKATAIRIEKLDVPVGV
jgi:formate dehydrogenase major subunit